MLPLPRPGLHEYSRFHFYLTIRDDRTSTGHVLGRVQPQQQTVQSERNLNPLSCGVLRCLTHLAMLLGTDQDIQVCLFKPSNIYLRSVLDCLASYRSFLSCFSRNKSFIKSLLIRNSGSEM